MYSIYENIYFILFIYDKSILHESSIFKFPSIRIVVFFKGFNNLVIYTLQKNTNVPVNTNNFTKLLKPNILNTVFSVS